MDPGPKPCSLLPRKLSCQDSCLSVGALSACRKRSAGNRRLLPVLLDTQVPFNGLPFTVPGMRARSVYAQARHPETLLGPSSRLSSRPLRPRGSFSRRPDKTCSQAGATVTGVCLPPGPARPATQQQPREAAGAAAPDLPRKCWVPGKLDSPRCGSEVNVSVQGSLVVPHPAAHG